MNVIANDIRDAIEKELEAANAKFPLFHSWHEAYAVISEELEEASDEIAEAMYRQSNAWKNIKRNYSDNVLENITAMRFAAERLAIEAVQVAAMCEKAFQSAKTWEE